LGARSANAAAIDAASLFHDGHNLFYRTPFGAVASGTSVTLRLRTAHQGATAATLYVDDNSTPSAAAAQIPMQVTSSDTQYDYWEGKLAPSAAGFYGYRFLVANGSDQEWYASKALTFGAAGQASSNASSGNDYELTSYAPTTFKTPSWMKNAVVYQIFVDRFFNGDKSNDHKLMDPVFGTDQDLPGIPAAGAHPIVHTNPNDPPTLSLAYGQLDFYGGDLQGVIDKLPYLKKLGINTLYFLPIFQSPTNHGYHTADYMQIAPHYGTLKTFKALIKKAHADKMHAILDGVFDFVASDSKYFNKYGHFTGTGAYQSQSSPYYPWFTFQKWPDQYSSYFSLQYLPALNETDAVKNFIFAGKNSVAQYWLKQGADGWRLDSSNLKSDSFWQGFNQSVQARFPKDVTICECNWPSQPPYFEASHVMAGGFDGAMNYDFRAGANSFFAHGQEGFVNVPFTATQFLNYQVQLLAVTPAPEIYGSMNNVGSHDTDRILDVLNGNVAALEQVAAFQMTWPGAPMIYYGDEAGLRGSGQDAFKRLPFPWSNPNTQLQAFYRKVINLRDANQALRDGSVIPLVSDDANRIVAYLRKDSKSAAAVVINDGAAAQDVTIASAGFKSGSTLVDAVSGTKYRVSGATLTVHVTANTTAILVPQPKKKK
jgi:glycosidase